MDFFSLMFSPFSHWGILVGGVGIFLILGYLWYSPLTPIGRKWISYFPVKETSSKPKGIVPMILLQILMGLIITHTVTLLWIYILEISPLLGEIGSLEKTLLIVKIYMGFVFIKDLGHWFFEEKPFPLVLIGVGYYLVGILGVCGLLTCFL